MRATAKKMTKGSSALLCMALVLVCSGAMLWVDGVLRPPYAVKSAIKAVLFLASPLLYARAAGDDTWRTLFRADRRTLLRALARGGGVFALIMLAAFALRALLDAETITALLGENAGVTGENYGAVTLYIAFVNSALEEWFFRGFAFLALRRVIDRRAAFLFSALAFALYHTAMLLGWFSPRLFVLALLGLAAGGMIFNLLDAKSGSIFPSWAVHICANLAINTVGAVLLGLA